jgi:hypothetical protein
VTSLGISSQFRYCSLEEDEEEADSIIRLRFPLESRIGIGVWFFWVEFRFLCTNSSGF